MNQIRIEGLIPLRYKTGITCPFIICDRLRVQNDLQNFDFATNTQRLRGPARINETYATFHRGEWHRVRVKQEEADNGQIKKMVDYLDTNGIVDLHPRIILYTITDLRTRTTVPPAHMKIFLYGLVGCDFSSNDFRRLFGLLTNQPQITGIFYQINTDRYLPIYAGDFIFNNGGTFVSFRDKMLAQFLAGEAKLGDANNVEV